MASKGKTTQGKTKKMWAVLWGHWLPKNTKHPVGAIFGRITNAKTYAERTGHTLVPVIVPSPVRKGRK